MKVLMLIFIFGTYAHYVTADQPGFYWSKSGLNITILGNTIVKKCIDANNTHHCKAASNNYNQCISTLDPFPLEPVDDYQGFCRYIKEKQLSECVKNFVNDLLPVLDKTETYLQHLLLNAFNSSIEELCGIDGFSNTKYLYETYNRTFQCLVFTVNFSIMINGTCISESNALKNLDKGVLNLSKESVCLDLESLQKCTIKEMKYYCREDLSKFFDLIFRPFLEDCNTLSKRILNYKF